MTEHLKETRKTDKNRRNGYAQKNMQSSLGGFAIFSPRDRKATFEPLTIAKRQRG